MSSAPAPLHLRRQAPAELDLDPAVIARLVERTGPLAVVDLETTGLAHMPGAEPLEVGVVLLDGAGPVVTLHTLLRPSGPIPPAIGRLTGLRDADVADAPTLAEVAPALQRALEGRTLVAHNAEFERHFLGRFVAPALATAPMLDTLDLLALTHPDAPDLRLESFTRALLGREERHRALDDALDTARVLSRVGADALAGEARYRTARETLARFAAGSPWLALLGEEKSEPSSEPRPALEVRVEATPEPPVAFDEDAIAAVLSDAARGRRYFPGYRVREGQVALARRFVRALRDGGVTLVEGGTGVGKSLAYLAAALPFCAERAAGGITEPILVSTRTKLLQDQLLEKDIAATARMFGHGTLRAVSIKGRANYVCARRLERALAEGAEPSLFPQERLAYAALAACARTLPHGEIGSVPAALLRRYPSLPGLLRRAVAARAEQCSREQCARRPECPFGRRRRALAGAHLAVANHDLLLRWPPDYPRFTHCIVDEVHELGGVADEVYALQVQPQELLERVDDVFGRPARGAPGAALLRGRERRELAGDALHWRRALQQDLVALGRALAPLSGEFGEVQLPRVPGPRYAAPEAIAASLASSLETVATAIEARIGDEEEAGEALERAAADLRAGGAGLRAAFTGAGDDAVAGFEAVAPPFDRWRLVVRPVSPAAAFHEQFLARIEALAGVSASLFIEGDAFAALGEIELEPSSPEARVTVESPFPYASHMRVLALHGTGDLVADTARVIERLALQLRGRTLGLFTSLRRLADVAERLTPPLRDAGIEVLAPRRAADDPGALVERFQGGDAVLLGARRFWQGLDVPGPALQAVVIEKLPFEVPTELLQRRHARMRAAGIDAFGRHGLGRMLLALRQMVGRLIRSEDDRGLVVIVEARTDRSYFRRLSAALPPGVVLETGAVEDLDALVTELGLGRAGAPPEESR